MPEQHSQPGFVARTMEPHIVVVKVQQVPNLKSLILIGNVKTTSLGHRNRIVKILGWKRVSVEHTRLARNSLYTFSPGRATEWLIPPS